MKEIIGALLGLVGIGVILYFLSMTGRLFISSVSDFFQSNNPENVRQAAIIIALIIFVIVMAIMNNSETTY